MLPLYQVLFVANLLGCVTLAAALYLSISPLVRLRLVIRVWLISIAVVSSISYFYVHARGVVEQRRRL